MQRDKAAGILTSIMENVVADIVGHEKTTMTYGLYRFSYEAVRSALPSSPGPIFLGDTVAVCAPTATSLHDISLPAQS